MTDTKFKEILKILIKIHKIKPDLRFGEIIQGSVDIVGVNNANFYDLSSKQVLNRLKDYEAKL